MKGDRGKDDVKYISRRESTTDIAFRLFMHSTFELLGWSEEKRAGLESSFFNPRHSRPLPVSTRTDAFLLYLCSSAG